MHLIRNISKKQIKKIRRNYLNLLISIKIS